MSFYQSYKWLLPSLVFSLLLIITRIVATGEITYLFIAWNLFLALLPLYFSHKARNSAKHLVSAAWGAVWLLFFPNALYIVTDLFHLDQFHSVPKWFDLVLLISAAMNGLIYGLMSLYNIEQKLRTIWPHGRFRFILFSLMVLCGYGIYLGRYLRWNSWDIITNPVSLANDMIHHVIHPIRNFNIWSLSIVFAVWMLVLYDFIKHLRRGN
jgi:uncharacterized membrane protein